MTDDLMTDDDVQRHGVGTQGRQMRVGAARLEAGDGGLGGVQNRSLLDDTVAIYVSLGSVIRHYNHR